LQIITGGVKFKIGLEIDAADQRKTTRRGSHDARNAPQC
jgi:hypothetical protein